MTRSGETSVRKFAVVAILASLIAGAAGLASAQHAHDHESRQRKAAADSRQLVRFPPALVEHTLANMRDHLQVIQELQEDLASGDTEKAAELAENRLGMSSLELHGAHEIAAYMPAGMQNAGTGMHRAASRFAIAARTAGATGDVKPALAALGAVTAQCVGCHALYRIR